MHIICDRCIKCSIVQRFDSPKVWVRGLGLELRVRARVVRVRLRVRVRLGLGL